MMNRPPRGAPAWGIALILLLACGLSAGGADAKHAFVPRNSVGLGVGYRPPDFSASDLQGRPHALTTYRGFVLVLHFWASWCPYCRSEIPELTQLSKPEWGSRGVRVLTVSTDQDLQKLQQFLEKAGLPYPIIADITNDFAVSDEYAVSGVPVTYIIGRTGHIASRLNGAGDITGEVQKALALTDT